MMENFPFQFDFPSDQEEFRVIKGLQDLKQKISNAQQIENIQQSMFHVSQPKVNHIYAYCTLCSSRMKYRIDGQTYRLLRFSNHHSHRHYKSTQNSLIQQFISHLPLSMSLRSKKILVKQQFGINDRQFYYFHHKVLHLTTDFFHLTKKLDEESYQSRFKPFPLAPKVIPDIFITSSKTMKQNYLKYGQFVSVDVTYNIIKEKSNGIGWGVCLLFGMNSHNHIVPYAIAIMNNESEESFSELFLSFFQMMGRQPQTIISDQQMAIKSSLSKLQESGSWSGTHLFDKYHILKNLKKKLKQSSQLFTILKNSIVLKDSEAFQSTMEQAYRHVNNQYEAKVVKEFVDKSNKYSLCNTPATFFGLSISTSFGEKANDIIKSYIQFEVPAIQCLQSLLKICKTLQQKSSLYKICKIKYQDVMNDQQLRMIRFHFCQKVFEAFLKNYVQSLKLRSQIIDQQTWKIYSQEKATENVEVRLAFDTLRCSCELQIKQGIPCPHLLLICRICHKNYLDYFHHRWKLDISQKEKRTVYHKLQGITLKKGRPRFSRRNVL